MKVQIDGEEILDIDTTAMTALNWRLAEPKEWIKNAVIGQISHAKGEMVKMETQRVRGREVGMPTSLSEDDMVTWLATQPGYKTAFEKREEQRISMQDKQ